LLDVQVGVHCTIPWPKCTFWPWNSTVLTDLDIYTGFIPAKLMTNTSGCYYSLYYTLAPNILGYSVCNLPDVTLPATRILRGLLTFLEKFAQPPICRNNTHLARCFVTPGLTSACELSRQWTSRSVLSA